MLLLHIAELKQNLFFLAGKPDGQKHHVQKSMVTRRMALPRQLLVLPWLALGGFVVVIVFSRSVTPMQKNISDKRKSLP